VNYRSFTEQYLDSCGIFKDAVLAILAVIAKQERVRLSERTLAGLAKARKQGRVGGRPRIAVRRDQVAAHRAEGLSISKISEKMRIPRTSVHRILKELAA
jgi:DNA invertase Pin-like site-specific DNA recombinase